MGFFNIPSLKYQISGIYIIQNLNNDKVYVGMSKDIIRRLNGHRSELESGKHIVSDMQLDYNNGDHFIGSIVRTFKASKPTYLTKLLKTYEYETMMSFGRHRLYNRDLTPPYLWETIVWIPDSIRPSCKYHHGDIYNSEYQKYILSESDPNQVEYEFLKSECEKLFNDPASKFRDIIKYLAELPYSAKENAINELAKNLRQIQ